MKRSWAELRIALLLVLTFQAIIAENGANAKAKFIPTAYDKLQPYVDVTMKKIKEIQQVEKSFKFDDQIDGIQGRFTSTPEKALYVSLVIGEDKAAVKDAIYFFKKCMLGNLKSSVSYSSGLDLLAETGKSQYGITNSEIDEIIIRAYFDHFIDDNSAAKKINAKGRADIIDSVAGANATRSAIYKREIVNHAINLASQNPIDTSLYGSLNELISFLNDPKLQKVIRVILEKAVDGDQSYRKERYD